ncbi:MAG: hypothetical protein QXT73_06790 [Candidatus Methanomethylicaceae archaeon]
MNLLAFKALKKSGQLLLSPTRESPWRKKYIPQLGGEYFFLDADKCPDLENCNGVYAGTFVEAGGYGSDIYLVAPLPSPETVVVLGNSGWRASTAIVVGGPYSRDNDDDRIKAAEQIIAAAQMGYETIPGIWLEAITFFDEAGLSLPERATDSKPVIDVLTRLARGEAVPPFLDKVDNEIREKAALELAKAYIRIDENGGDFLQEFPNDDIALLGDLIKAFHKLKYDALYIWWAIFEKLDITGLIKRLIEAKNFEALRIIFESLSLCYVPEEKILTMMEMVLPSGNKWVINSIILQCNWMGSVNTIPILETIAKSVNDDDLLSGVANACGTIGAEAIPILEYLLDEKGTKAVLLAVAKACERIGREAFPLLPKFIGRTDDLQTVSVVFSACMKIGAYGLIRRLLKVYNWCPFNIFLAMVDSDAPKVGIIKSVLTIHPEYSRSLDIKRAVKLANLIKDKSNTVGKYEPAGVQGA